METWSRLPQQFENAVLVVVVPSLSPEIEGCDKGRVDVCVLLDPKGRTAKRYNAGWLPRAYAVDERGLLTYVQGEATLDPQAPLEVEALWRQPRGRQVVMTPHPDHAGVSSPEGEEPR